MKPAGTGSVAVAMLLASCQGTPVPVVPQKHSPGPMSCDHLSPAQSQLTNPFPDAAQHEARISASLLSRIAQASGQNDGTADQLLMVLVKQDPRFPEEAVYVLQTPPRPTRREYHVVHARARRAVDSAEGVTAADFSEALIDAEAVQALELSWGRMTREARWPDREHAIKEMKFRGVTYTFDYVGDNVYGQGTTISPEPGTCAASMVDLGELLIRFADERDPENRQALRDQLLRQSRALAERLNH